MTGSTIGWPRRSRRRTRKSKRRRKTRKDDKRKVMRQQRVVKEKVLRKGKKVLWQREGDRANRSQASWQRKVERGSQEEN